MKHIYTSRNFILLFVMNFCFFTGLNTLTVLPDHLAALGASKTLIGLFMNFNSLVMVIFIVPLSLHTERIGRRRLMLWGFGVGILAFAGMVFCSHSLVLLFVLRLAGTLGFMAGFTIVFVEALDLMPPERRASGLAVFGISGLLSNPAGARIGELALSLGWIGTIFVVAAVLWGVVFVLCLVFPFHHGHDPERKPVSLFALMKRPRLWPLMVLSLAAGGAFAVFATFLANLSRERLGVVNVSGFFAASAAVGMCFRLFFSSLLDKVSKKLLAALCFVLFAASYALAWFLAQGWELPVMGLIFGLATGMIFPMVSTLFVEAGEAEERLGLSNLSTSVNTLGNLVFAMGLGGVGDAFGTPAIFLSMAGLALVMAVFVLWRVRDLRFELK